MQKVSLNDIPRWSPWPVRLLGLAPWTPPSRTTTKVESEYNLDKYARCLAFARGAAGRGPQQVKDFELGDLRSGQLLISVGEDLGAVPQDEATRRYYDLLVATLAPALAQAATVVELGCGYGYNLWVLQQRLAGLRYLGGDFSANAVELARHLFGDTPTIAVRQFDFYQTDFAWVADQPAPLVVFTSHAIEQVPKFGPVLQRMADAFRGRSVTVFHFEPAYRRDDDSLLGLLRRRYAEVNDYNRDLWDQVHTVPGIRVRQARPDVLGWNPFSPTSILEWTPERKKRPPRLDSRAAHAP